MKKALVAFTAPDPGVLEKARYQPRIPQPMSLDYLDFTGQSLHHRPIGTRNGIPTIQKLAAIETHFRIAASCSAWWATRGRVDVL